MKSLDKIVDFVAKQKNGATRYEVYEALEYCWQTVNASMYTLEQEGVVEKTGETRLSIWSKPNSVYRIVS